jgi:hypothetical protein
VKRKSIRFIFYYFAIGAMVTSILNAVSCSPKNIPSTTSAILETSAVPNTSTYSTSSTIPITTTSSTTLTIATTQTLSTTASNLTWSLNLVGVVTRVVDRSLFTEGTAPGCHGATWKDAEGQVWSGIPLWLLAGYVDNKNNAMEIDPAVWSQGFEVQVVSANGTTADFTSAQIYNNDNMIVAYQVNGQSLPVTQWPLALVGAAFDQQHEISQITEIKLILPSTTMTTSTTVQ